ncbi:MAG: hypothetical protein ACM3NT_05930 [Methylocystaceae bacterium]
MPEKKEKITGLIAKNKAGNKEPVIISNKDNECPVKQGDNCLVPGAYNDSDPIGGG